MVSTPERPFLVGVTGSIGSGKSTVCALLERLGVPAIDADQVSRTVTEVGRPVLEGLSLEVQEGESTAILGPSGSGKTTLLNLIGGLDYPDQGSVMFNGRDITGYTTREMDRYRNSEIGFVFQFHHLLPQCTLLENVLVPTLVSEKNE